MIELRKEFIDYKNIIYFLYQGEQIVYIGESENGVSRALSHKDKVFDRVKIFESTKNPTYRKSLEASLIIKHRPKYNKQTINYAEGYISLENIREKLKQKNRYDITNILKKIVKENCRFNTVKGVWYVHLEDIKKLLNIQFNQTI